MNQLVLDPDDPVRGWSQGFLRIGRGELGGKANGLVFFRDMLAAEYPVDRFPQLPVAVPASVAGAEVPATQRESYRWSRSWSGSGLEYAVDAVQATESPEAWEAFLLTLGHRCPAKVVAEQLGIEMPICYQVYRILYEGASPREAVGALMRRDLKSEH